MGVWFGMSPKEFLETPAWMIDILEERLEERMKAAEGNPKKALHYSELHILRGLRMAGL